MNKGDIRTLVVVVGGIFCAGLVMNALRDNAFVAMAINGYEK